MRAALFGLLLLAACGARQLPPEPADAELARLSRTGQLAFRQGRPDQAAGLFREALARARTRDDAVAITDQGINLAVAELRRRDDAAARDVAQDVREELGRRGAKVPPELLLTEATARWRLADPRAEALAVAAAEAPPTAGRAQFLLGLIAARRGDRAALDSARAAVTDPADAAELAAEAKRLAGDLAGARAGFLQAARGRQDQLDYAGMGRALAGAAAALPDAPDAGDLWLRAGRAAAGDFDRRNAEIWLARAAAGSGSAARDARAALATLRAS